MIKQWRTKETGNLDREGKTGGIEDLERGKSNLEGEKEDGTTLTLILLLSGCT